MPIQSGIQFGNYRIGEGIGEGGMGQVYLANDTTLERAVALKVLPESFAADADRVARFDREAKTLAALNHPNIAQIYGLEKGVRVGDSDTSGGPGSESQTLTSSSPITAIIMELVEGPTLADRIAHGPLPAEEALRIAKQLISGLEAAHDRGIVHRDLKPANIKVKPDGLVKILDFGIAKPIDIMGSSKGGATPTMVTPAVTETGVIMGTAAYMSPEQARGRFVDQRTDIWAFGCVLYEMLTGQPAFGGEDVMTTLARIIDRDANMDSIPGIVSPAVRHTIKLCLRKEVARRIRSISDVRLALEGEFESLPTGEHRAEKAGLLLRLLPMAATALVCIPATVLIVLELSPEPQNAVEAAAGEVRRSLYTLPADQNLNFPILPSISISADGSKMLYGANGQLYLRGMDELEGLPIAGTTNEEALVPSFSPDGNWIAYANGTTGGIKRVSSSGGTPQPVLNFVPSNGYTWADNNTLIYGQENEIWQVTSSGGSPQLLVTDEPGFDMIEPRIIPGTELILFERRSADRSTSIVSVANAATGEISQLFPGNQPVYMDGYLVNFDPNLGLLARSFDVQSLATGSPLVMVSDVLRVDRQGGGAQFRISSNGALLYVKGTVEFEGGIQMQIGDQFGNVRALSAPRGLYEFPAVSHDGTQVVVQDGANIMLYALDGSREIRQLTREGINYHPSWSPDDLWITFVSDRDGSQRIYRQRADGRGVAEPLTTGVSGQTISHPAWAPDGRLAYTAPSEGGSTDLWIVSIPLGEPELLVSAVNNQSGIAFSPLGNAFAYQSDEKSLMEVIIEPFPPDGSRNTISNPDSPGGWPVWGNDGKSIYFAQGTAGGVFGRVDLAIPGFDVLARSTLPYVAIPTTRRLAVIPVSNELMLTIPEQAASESGGVEEIVFVENWIEEIRQRVPME